MHSRRLKKKLLLKLGYSGCCAYRKTAVAYFIGQFNSPKSVFKVAPQKKNP